MSLRLNLIGAGIPAMAASLLGDAIQGVSDTLTAAELAYLDITTLGTGAASKAVVLDAGEDYTWPATGVLTYGVLKDPAGTTLGSTAAEINNESDISARMVAAGGTLAVTVALHAGKIIQLDTAAGSICTLPAAAGTGARFEFVTTVLATSNSHIVKVANGTDIMVGRAAVIDAADDSMTTFPTTGTSDTITFNRTTTGSVRIGERIVCVDVKAGFWAVDVVCVGTGGEATPFSATV